jgi:hypothetical protein
MKSETMSNRFSDYRKILDERSLRLVAAIEAKHLGYGGVTTVSQAAGLSRPVIMKGMKELATGDSGPTGRIRRPGGGRKRQSDKDNELKQQIELLVEPTSRGDPESPLRWTTKSVRNLSNELTQRNHPACPAVVAQLLHEMRYSLQSNRKTKEGGDHPDRDQQFQYINKKVIKFQRQGQPVISVDTKKKELVGDFKNGGREWRPEGQPEKVRVHDFIIPELGRAAPYGVYDILRNEGWVSVGMDHDTATFAVESIRRWWLMMGQKNYPEAKRLLITADGGGSNGSRVRLWKLELQQFANETGLAINVSHLPPGTSKWNKIEHRLFSHISMNWRGKPLTSYEVIVSLIAATKTEKGLHVECQLDTNEYPAGLKVRDEEMNSLNLKLDSFHGEWNYSLLPKRP